ncbi:MAG: glycoside hydrolase family 99-like domain-containing protein [Candidatus Hydrogenedentes bacterium]|nr:glycoside hydrolase family 99-like domain-containing protein [Candidatus Hydrogenedentota bacterium]
MFQRVLVAVYTIILAGFLSQSAAAAEPGHSAASGQSVVTVRSFLPVRGLNRAQRPSEVTATIENMTDAAVTVDARLILPDGVKAVSLDLASTVEIGDQDRKELKWSIEAQEAKAYDLRLEIRQGGAVLSAVPLTMSFIAPLAVQKQPYIPEPTPVKTDILVGAHNCPLWEADKPAMWSQLLKHPERTPALGFYAQENPEVADWETKWAVEHGVDYFIYCWYRAGQGGPVKMNFGSAIHDALLKSKFVDKMKFTIMWENQSRGNAGVSDENDLMQNLLPFWIDNYFRHPSYVKIDNKPLLFIYRPEFLIEDLGGEEKVAAAFDTMRQACKTAGFDGLYILGEYRGLDPDHLKQMKRLGLDYTFAYCWYVPDNPTPEKAIAAQVDQINKTQSLGIIPQVVTVSQAWSGWNDEGTIWKIPPADFKTLLRRAKDIIAAFPANELGSKMLILDNWNEWGEGHYLAPYREYGFGYLDAIREVFAKNSGPHTDLLPEDIGMGPYDTAYRAFTERNEQLRKQVSKKALKAGAPEDGLIAWWAFDEDEKDAVALDYSGNRLGGILRDAKRTNGIDGNALLCDGGSVEIVNSPRLSPPTALTIECWVKTDDAGQANTWFVNRVFGGGTSTGYRMGVVDGKPCFEVPQTDWSHHLKADLPLPTGRWVHTAGTFDGKVERIYIDGEEHGAMDRPGPINPNTFHLCLGNFEIGHAAHFSGLLDEVKLYDRALTPAEIREHYRRLADRVAK